MEQYKSNITTVDEKPHISMIAYEQKRQIKRQRLPD